MRLQIADHLISAPSIAEEIGQEDAAGLSASPFSSRARRGLCSGLQPLICPSVHSFRLFRERLRQVRASPEPHPDLSRLADPPVHGGTQRSKHWFDAETFCGLARLRGMECRAPDRYAEAFFARKVVLAP
jgi:hypothetical protein